MMRDKRRYILVESTTEIIESSKRDFENSFYRELLHNLGEINYFRANPKIVKFVGNKRFILKCSLAQYKETINAMTFIKHLNSKEIGFYTLNASGTISALTKDKTGA